MYKLIGLKSMHRFFWTIVRYIVLYFYTTLNSHPTVLFSVFCDLVPLAGSILKILLARGTVCMLGNWTQVHA